MDILKASQVTEEAKRREAIAALFAEYAAAIAGGQLGSALELMTDMHTDLGRLVDGWTLADES